MSRSKKTRKGGENSPKLQPRVKKQDRAVATGKRKEKDTGNKSGSRHNESLILAQAPQQTSAQKKDPRHGSKKPVALAIPAATPKKEATTKVKQPKLTDEQKLLKLEEDPRLNQLLDMLEEGRELNDADQQWLDQQLNKIEALMTKLGIGDEMDEAPPAKTKAAKPVSDDDLFDRFESGADLLKDYQDKL